MEASAWSAPAASSGAVGVVPGESGDGLRMRSSPMTLVLIGVGSGSDELDSRKIGPVPQGIPRHQDHLPDGGVGSDEEVRKR